MNSPDPVSTRASYRVRRRRFVTACVLVLLIFTAIFFVAGYHTWRQRAEYEAILRSLPKCEDVMPKVTQEIGVDADGVRWFVQGCDFRPL